MKFEWDARKAEKNEGKHEGVTFEEARETFLDGNSFEDYDDEHSDIEEKRFIRIGNSSRRLLRVSYMVREDETDDEIIRIISARKARTEDERLYVEQNEY